MSWNIFNYPDTGIIIRTLLPKPYFLDKQTIHRPFIYYSSFFPFADQNNKFFKKKNLEAYYLFIILKFKNRCFISIILKK